MSAKFGLGDKVEVVNYSHPINMPKELLDEKSVVIQDNGDRAWIDMSPELVGQRGLISGRSKTQGQYSYSIKGIKGKSAWYSEDQLKMINQNPNNQ